MHYQQIRNGEGGGGEGSKLQLPAVVISSATASDLRHEKRNISFEHDRGNSVWSTEATLCRGGYEKVSTTLRPIHEVIYLFKQTKW